MRSFISGFVVIALLVTHVSPAYAKGNQLTLSTRAQEAVHTLAKNILTDGLNPAITAIRPQLDPQDYATVQQISLLPDSPFYFFKSTWRGIRLFFTFNEVGKTYQRLHDGNEKTLEALLLLEKASKETSDTKHTRLVRLATKSIDAVGADFDTVSQKLDTLREAKSPRAAIIQEEAFRFAGYYLKHQILLQQQQDTLTSQDFVDIEAVRLKHLPSLAHIVVSENKNPEVFGEQLSQLVAPQTGKNYQNLATIAVLRDLEYSARDDEQSPLKAAQALLRQELEEKLSDVSVAERLRRVDRYTGFIHGNPVRQFQAYNHLSRSFTSDAMNELTLGLKDQTAQNLKAHLASLDTPKEQQQFMATLFSNDPVDFRVLAYLEIQLEQPQVLAATAFAQEETVQTNDQQTELARQNLRQIEDQFKTVACQTYGENPDTLLRSRFYQQAATTPDILDIRIARFLDESLQQCTTKAANATDVMAQVQEKVTSEYVAQALATPTTTLPSRAQAEAILEQTGITTPPAQAQKVAQQLTEETQDIQQELSQNTKALEQEVAEVSGEEVSSSDAKQESESSPTPSPQAIVRISPTPTVSLQPTLAVLPSTTPVFSPQPTASTSPVPTILPSTTPTPSPTEADLSQDVVEEEQQIIEDTVQSNEPTEEEIVEKEQQIVDEIITEAQSGETSPLVEELPEEVQQEIVEQTQTATPIPTSTATPSATPIVTTIVEPVVSSLPSPTPTPTPAVTPIPSTPSPTPTSVIEPVVETVADPTPTPDLSAPGL